MMQIATIAPLTGIRFIAAIFVFNAHIITPTSAGSVASSLSFAGNDWMTMFFMLSGLVLTWNYETALSGPIRGRALRSYFVARFARIYPLYLVALIAAAVALSIRSGEFYTTVANPEFALHVFALQTWSPDLAVAYGYNAPGWSVGVEIFLYALFPLLLIPFRSIHDKPWALVAVGVASIAVVVALTAVLVIAGNAELPREDPWSAHRWLYRTPLTRIFDFVLGMSLGHLIIATKNRDFTHLGRGAQIVGVIFVVSAMLIPSVSASVWSIAAAVMAPFALLLLGLAWAPTTALGRFLGTRTMVFLGECSYAFYLFHLIVITIIGQPSDGLVSWVSIWTLAFVLTAIVAIAAHLFIERPARTALRRSLDPRSSRRRESDPSAPA